MLKHVAGSHCQQQLVDPRHRLLHLHKPAIIHESYAAPLLWLQQTPPRLDLVDVRLCCSPSQAFRLLYRRIQLDLIASPTQVQFRHRIPLSPRCGAHASNRFSCHGLQPKSTRKSWNPNSMFSKMRSRVLSPLPPQCEAKSNCRVQVRWHQIG
uniref:Uncharacterized protein n=1 Tax=Arundo donax TaxID=35708 RepID=A0A0A9DGR9_ARUDO